MENHEYPNRYAVTLQGCDDSTTFCMFLNAESLGLLKQMQKAADSVSRDGCMPTIDFRRSTERDERDYVEAKAEKIEDGA